MCKKIIVISIIVLLSACNIDSKFFPKTPESSGEKIWTFIQYHVSDKEGVIEDYYYFGLIDKGLYEKIKTHETKDGLIFMEKVKFWNTEDVIESYDDAIYSDELAFRIEDIVKFELVKKEPVDGFRYDDEDIIEKESSLEINTVD
jgi:hypothetical protein